MKIPDVNVLVYASDTTSRQHGKARHWLEGCLSGTEAVGFGIVALLGYVRICTNPRVMESPLTATSAFDQVEEWLELTPATLVHHGPHHLAIWRELVESAGTAGNLTTDGHLAALAIEEGATFVTFDGDFHRFDGLDLEFLG